MHCSVKGLRLQPSLVMEACNLRAGANAGLSCD